MTCGRHRASDILRGCGFQVNQRNPAKFTKTRKIRQNSLEIVPNTCRHNIFESYLGCWGCLLTGNLLIYIEISSLQRVNNIREECCVLGRITPLYTFISPTKMTIFFSERFGPRMITPENLQNEQSSCSFSRLITNKPCTSSYYKNTVTADLKNKL